MPKVTESIQMFFNARKATHNGPDLLERWTPLMETQINVLAGEGEPVAGKRNTYSDGIYEWFSIRIPKNAYSDPEFRDYELKWPLDLHAEAIGCTGWDYGSRRSRYVGFDFDSITGHAAGVGVSEQELERVKSAAQALPYVEVRRSTGGAGLHLYVYFDEAGIPTANHTEHAALARAVLGMMSSDAGFDFASQIDVCGGNLWIWHRKATPENQGLARLKQASKVLGVSDLPPNWRDHIEVVTRRRAKVRVGAVPEEFVDPFEALANSRRVVPLDAKHKAIIDALHASGFSTVWVPDHHLLQTHTKALQNLLDDPVKRKQLSLLGFFKTNSEGRDPGTPNCFLFPVDDGGWRVYRFSPGINEADTWEQDGDGWTTCTFNQRPDLSMAARATSGAEMSGNAGFSFDTAEEALEAVAAMGHKVELPEKLLGRETHLKRNRDGRLVMLVKQRENEEKPSPRWAAKRGGWWEQVFNIQTENKSKKSETELKDCDNLVRQLITPSGQDAGLYMRNKAGVWQHVSTEKVKLSLLDHGRTDAEAKLIVGSAVNGSWTLVNMPFQAEYPGNRQWNMNAAQYRFQPAELGDDEAPYHPHWDMILRHCGQSLDAALKELDWARAANIKRGGDYLLHWAACMLREPYEKLPYLFLWGEQNSGKSIYHEALALLMTNGVAAADRALTNPNDFNGELANAVLGYIEEKDISLSPGAYNKLKDWVTSPLLWIRKMRTDAYSQVNTLHFVQTANEPEACTIKQNDTRITMIYVPPLPEGQEIPKPVLMQRLEEEAPHFMRTILDMALPPMIGRLRLPIVNTEDKEQLQADARNPLEAFVAENCYEAPGQTIPFAEFFDRFQKWLSEDGRAEMETSAWTNKRKIARSLPFNKFPYGIHTGNVRCIGNISWEEPVGDLSQLKPFVLRGGRLKHKE